jgi:hypothetical protein
MVFHLDYSQIRTNSDNSDYGLIFASFALWFVLNYFYLLSDDGQLLIEPKDGSLKMH